jgi:colanic acid/amylovoran biosynthesis glycosyltransferase
MTIVYLIGQYPAINHYYLLREIHYLRAAGHRIYTASVAEPDRPAGDMRPSERQECDSTFYLKRQSPLRAARLAIRTCLQHPGRFLQAFKLALQSSRRQQKPAYYSLYYLAEALLLIAWMKPLGLRHIHASFTSTIAWLAAEIDPQVTFSFGVYGYGELYDPVGHQLTEKIDRALCVRSVSWHGIGQLMLATPPQNWNKLHHVDLGIDPAEFPPRTAPFAPAVLPLITVGRLAPEKGHRLMLEMMEELLRRERPVRLHIVGNGPDRSYLEAQVKRRSLETAVVFEGRVPQKRLEELYSQAGVFLLGSLYEGTPIVLMEAMAMRIPCLAPAVNGIPEVVADGETGLLFPAADPAAMARQVERLLADPGLREQFAEKGRQRVLSLYDLERNTRRWAAVLQAALSASTESR